MTMTKDNNDAVADDDNNNNDAVADDDDNNDSGGHPLSNTTEDRWRPPSLWHIILNLVLRTHPIPIIH